MKEFIDEIIKHSPIKDTGEAAQILENASSLDALKEVLLNLPSAPSSIWKPSESKDWPGGTNHLLDDYYLWQGDNAFNLNAGINSLGREGTDIIYDGEGSIRISRKHAIISVNRDKIVIQDVGSNNKGTPNGTFVNGDRLSPMEKREIFQGDIISLANIVDFELRK